jgi:hypothetical protein
VGYFFGFESSQERALALIPMLVRMKLDTCGVKLALAQWNKLPERNRRRLFELPCESSEQATAYRSLLCELVKRHTGEDASLLPPTVATWNDVAAVPDQVTKRAEQAGIAVPTVEQWRSLTGAQRYALLKLTREGHESLNYLPALREFALL